MLVAKFVPTACSIEKSVLTVNKIQKAFSNHSPNAASTRTHLESKTIIGFVFNKFLIFSSKRWPFADKSSS